MNTISKLNSDDLMEAYAVEMESHVFPWSKALFYSNQGKSYRNYKLCCNTKLVGFCIIHTVLDEATLYNIAIHPSHQYQGLATLLLKHALQELTKQDILTVWLEVRASNHAAQHLYKKLGFHPISTRPNYYPASKGTREDAIIMAKQLKTE